MRRPTVCVFTVPWLIFMLCLTACSDDDAPSDAPSSAPPSESAAAEASAPAVAQDETRSSESKASPSSPWPENATDLFDSYDEQCPPEEDASLDCEWLRGLIVADVVQALEEIEQSRDQRGVEEALAALDIVDEPEVLIAACRVLGYFPDTPGVVEKALPLLLESPYLAVQQAAARLLSRTQDPAIAGIGSQWSSNHGVLYTDEPYEELSGIPEQYSAMAFPEYSGAQRYTPADSDRSVGWWVRGAPAEVSAWFADELDVAVLTYSQWSERVSQQFMNAYQEAMNRPENARLQQLMEEYTKNQDPALIEEMQQVQAVLEVQMKKIENEKEKSMDNLAQPPSGVAFEDVYFLVAEEQAGHVSRLVMVYRQTGSERTVMQMMWNLQDYPPAWPVEN